LSRVEQLLPHVLEDVAPLCFGHRVDARVWERDIGVRAQIGDVHRLEVPLRARDQQLQPGTNDRELSGVARFIRELLERSREVLVEVHIRGIERRSVTCVAEVAEEDAVPRGESGGDLQHPVRPIVV